MVRGRDSERSHEASRRAQNPHPSTSLCLPCTARHHALSGQSAILDSFLSLSLVLPCPTSSWLNSCRVAGPPSRPVPLAISFPSSAFSSCGCVLTVPVSVPRYGRAQAEQCAGCQTGMRGPRAFFQPLSLSQGRCTRQGSTCPTQTSISQASIR